MFSKRLSGFTLIEMVIAIVIIGVGLAGLLTAFNTAVRSSADPLVNKQLLAIAEEMQAEILAKPFAVNGTAPANSLKSCGGGSPPSRAAFDDVSDYNAYQTTGVCDIDGFAVAGLESYSVSVSVDSGAALGLAAGQVKTVQVVVTNAGNNVTLLGWRTNFAP